MIAPRASAQAKTRRYTRGTEYLEAGNYEKALKVFSALGDYEDAPTAAAYAEKGIAYTQAKEAIKLGDFEKAGSSFDALDDFEDARKLAAECRRALAYEAGKAFYAEANYDAAIEALEAAKGYGDSKTLLDRCRLTVTQRDIENAMRVGDYASALSLLETEISAKVENGLLCSAGENESYFEVYPISSTILSQKPIEPHRLTVYKGWWEKIEESMRGRSC